MSRKLSQYKYYPLIRDYCMILFGALITGASYTYFFIPNNIAPGGITGVATVLNHLIGWPPVGTLSFLLNIPLFLLGYKSGGKLFVLRSFIAMMLLSLFIDILPGDPITDDGMLASIFGGIFLGLGLGLVLRAGATTGGTDLAAQMVHKRFSFISVGTFLFAIDCMVISLAGAELGANSIALEFGRDTEQGFQIKRVGHTNGAVQRVSCFRAEQLTIAEPVICQIKHAVYPPVRSKYPG